MVRVSFVLISAGLIFIADDCRRGIGMSTDNNYVRELEKYSDDLMERLDARWRQKVANIPAELWEMPLDRLKKLGKIDKDIELLRDSFWAEYDRAVASGRNISLRNVYDGICSQSKFSMAMDSPSRLLYVLTPIARYEAHLRTLLRTKGVDILDTILNADNQKDGRLDKDIARLQLLTIKQIEDRIKGLPVNRVLTREESGSEVSDMSRDEIIEKIAKLEKDINTYPGKKEEDDGKNDDAEDARWESCDGDDEPSTDNLGKKEQESD